MSSATARHDRTNYQGKRLLSLLLAICLPPALLYLRLVLGIAASDSRVGPQQSLWLGRTSLVALILFAVVQLTCARYLQRLFIERSGRARDVLQYLVFLIVCVLFSLTAAITLEAFGLNFFLRTAAPR